MKNIVTFENNIINDYNVINKLQEEDNQEQLTNLLNLFENKKVNIKNTIFNLHKDLYNIRRDIIDNSVKLDRIYNMKRNSQDKKNLVKFEIDRLATDLEKVIDEQNNKIKVKQKQVNNIIKNFNNFVNKNIEYN